MQNTLTRRWLAPLVLALGLALPASPASALTLLLASDTAAPQAGRCLATLSAFGEAPVALAATAITARDLRSGAELDPPREAAAQLAGPTRLLDLDLPGDCADIRMSLGAVTCGGAPCDPPPQAEVFGLAGLRLPPPDPAILAAAVASAEPVAVGAVFAAEAAPPVMAASSPDALPRLEPDTDRPGGDLGWGERLEAGGPAACLLRCQEEPACLGFTFVPEAPGAAAGDCWLKAELADPVPNPGMTSGVVRLVAAPPAEIAPAETPPTEALPGVSPEWALAFQRVEDGPEGRLVIRVGDVDNLGHGWEPGYDPFSGRSTTPHPWPFSPEPGDPPGTDRIMLGTGVIDPGQTGGGDGYHQALPREETMPEAVVIPLENLPPGFTRVFLQLFVDDFQAPFTWSEFQITLNGRRMPAMERALNAIDQSGPVGELLTLLIPPEHHDLLAGERLEIFIDDPTTGAGDGYALDFVRLVLDPALPDPASLRVAVLDHADETPIPGAGVTALDLSATADAEGRVEFTPLPGGRVAVTASAPGYQTGAGLARLVIRETAELTIWLRRDTDAPPAEPQPEPPPAAVAAEPDPESDTALRAALERNGRVVLRGIRFDTDSDIPRPDSLPALEALLRLIQASGDDRRWLIEGHTDSSGGAAHNRFLSMRRAAAVTDWLVERGIAPAGLEAVGHGPDRPVASNTDPARRALNRRVEAAPLP